MQRAEKTEAAPRGSKRKREPGSSPESSKRSLENSQFMSQDAAASAVPSIVVDQPGSSLEPEKAIPDVSNLAETHQSLADPQILPLSSQKSTDSEHSTRRPDNPGFVIPPSVKFALRGTFDTVEGSEITNLSKDSAVSLFDPESYRQIESKAQSYVQKIFADELGSGELFFRYGNCTILGEKEYRSRRPLTSPQDWQDILTAIINYRTTHRNGNVRLVIWRRYSGYRSRPSDNTSLTAAKNEEIHALMRYSPDQTLERFTYIPLTDLERVVPRHMVPDIINEASYRDMDETQKLHFIQNVQSRARILLAICLYGEIPMECLRILLDKNIDDSKLPLARDDRCHKPRCVKKFDDLIEKQGRFRAARFDKPGEHQTLDHRRVVPIQFCSKDDGDYPNNDAAAESPSGKVKEPGQGVDNIYIGGSSAKDKARCGSGAFSTVYRVRLDPNHHALSKDRDAYFALKEFRRRDCRVTTDFEKELRILNELRRYSHSHIVTHLASWTQDEMYYMLFPYAQCNLQEYMRQRTFRSQEKEEILWVLNQLQGLASALNQIHDMSDEIVPASVSSPLLQPPSPVLQGEHRSGWHHDLKPENILYFWDTDPPRGIFRIADWGSGKVNTYRSGSVNTPSPNGTLTYEPPEFMLEGKTSRPYDVWSLGCVFLELLVWALQGSNAVETFREHRSDRRDLTSASRLEDDAFWQKNFGGVNLRQSVTQQFYDLKKVISEEKLTCLEPVLELVKQMLNLERDKRIRALDVYDTLRRICQQTKMDFEDGNSPDADKNDLLMTRLSVKAPERRSPDLGTFANSPTSRHMGLGFTDHLFASPTDTMSPHMRRSHSRNTSTSELGPSATSQRSRTNSNTSTTMSVREGKTGLSNALAPDTMEERK